MPSSRSRASVVPVGPVARYNPTDSRPVSIRPLAAYTPKLLAGLTGLDRAVAQRMITAARKPSFEGIAFLRARVDPRHGHDEPGRPGRVPDHMRGVALEPVLARAVAPRPFRDRIVQLAVGARRAELCDGDERDVEQWRRGPCRGQPGVPLGV